MFARFLQVSVRHTRKDAAPFCTSALSYVKLGFVTGSSVSEAGMAYGCVMNMAPPCNSRAFILSSRPMLMGLRGAVYLGYYVTRVIRVIKRGD